MWSDAFLIAGVGFGVVFAVLALLMVCIRIVRSALSAKRAKKTEPAQ